jgi:hypothetical protein
MEDVKSLMPSDPLKITTEEFFAASFANSVTRDLIEIKKISHSCSEYRNSVFEVTSSGIIRCFSNVTQSVVRYANFVGLLECRSL